MQSMASGEEEAKVTAPSKDDDVVADPRGTNRWRSEGVQR